MDKNYSSIYSIKDFAIKEVAPKFFNMDEVNDLNIGLLGYTTELISNLTEDNFNTITLYMNEMFPNLAVLPESIYNYAALFQIDGTFAVPAELDVMLFLAESDIINNASRVRTGTNVSTNDQLYEFFLDSNMTIDIEGIQFMPDYDIRINYKPYNGDYIFTATYETKRYNATYNNSLSSIVNPYIRIKRINYNGVKYLVLLIKTHQVHRFTQTETILSNDIISSPTFAVEFDDSLASFDVFYTDPTTNVTTQLKKRLSGSSPLSEPFCYYKMKDENKLEITFTTRDNYFQPKFNSEINIDYTITSGEKGNFPLYTGNDITVVPASDTYGYNNNIVLFAIPQSASFNGKNKPSLEELKNIVIEKYSTVDSYTNENDLQLYFNNFKDTFNSEILFIKKRDDIFERLFTSFSLFKDNNNDIYHTNTLNLDITPDQFDNEDEQRDIYILNAGQLFTYKNELSTNTVKIAKDADGNKLKLNKVDVTNLSLTENFIYTNPFLIYFTKSPTVVGYYLNTVNTNHIVDYTWVNDESLVQFICNSVNIQRNAIVGDTSYTISVMLTPTLDLQNPLVIERTDDNGEKIEEPTKQLIVRLGVENGGSDTCFIDLTLTEWDIANQLYTFTGNIETNDQISSTDTFVVTNMINSKSGIVESGQTIPMTGCKLNVYTWYNPTMVTEMELESEPTLSLSSKGYICTNKYSTDTNRVSFIYPVQMMRSRASYIDDAVINPETGEREGTDYHININSIPFVRASTMLDENAMTQFYTTLTAQYNYISGIINKITNNYSIDMKFYNTYGKSINFKVGDNADIALDRVNISIHIKVKPLFGTNEEEFIRDLKIYIKNYIETINDNGSNSIYISNLIQSLENDFPNLSYMKFVQINNHGTDVQVIENVTSDLSLLTKEDRMNYVPEYLTISLEDIIIDII